MTYLFGKPEDGTETYNLKRGKITVPHRLQKVYKNGKEYASVELIVTHRGEVGMYVKYKPKTCKCCED